MKTFILAAIILSLTGCAGLQQAFDAGAAAAAVSL
jgi:hypothetical protein